MASSGAECAEPELWDRTSTIVLSIDRTVNVSSVVSVIQCLLYGAYVVLFGICVHILSKRRAGRYRLHCLLITVLFAFATVAVIVVTVTMVRDNQNSLEKAMSFAALCIPRYGEIESWVSNHFPLVGSRNLDLKLGLVRTVLLIGSNIFADTILIWRCFVLWGRRRRIIILPVLSCMANNASAIISLATAPEYMIKTVIYGITNCKEYHFYAAFLIGSVLTNVFITGLLAGRILYISRQSTDYIGKDVNKMYRMILAITLESGLLYPVFLIIFLSCYISDSEQFSRSLSGLRAPGVISLVAGYSLHQIAGIAPTLVIVRTSLGISIEDSRSLVSTFRTQADDQALRSDRTVLDDSRSAMRERAPTHPTDIEARGDQHLPLPSAIGTYSPL
ncbi:hypothetical protein WG66_005469 [Moniliophthora roreri]|uniref:Integral membrane protein n=1 Tax=Moniliophthora roreri TaxID=221103 RepID=A0A0W0G586_MONRR|nr:hypothetical protein WG66_005469 [Moniliophthora roreri]